MQVRIDLAYDVIYLLPSGSNIHQQLISFRALVPKLVGCDSPSPGCVQLSWVEEGDNRGVNEGG